MVSDEIKHKMNVSAVDYPHGVNKRFHVDVGKVNPIGRLAGKGGYTRITDRFEMPRIKPGTDAE